MSDFTFSPAVMTSEAMPRLRGRTPLPRDQIRLSVLMPVYNEQHTTRWT
jgi:hypothetical protein